MEMSLNLVIRKDWNTSVSRRNVLYYSFLEMYPFVRASNASDANIRKTVKEYVTVEDGDFERIIEHYCRIGVMVSKEKCTLSTEALTAIEEQFRATYGTADLEEQDGLRFNGSKICHSKLSDPKRFELWVSKGEEYLKNVFSSVPNIKFDSKRIEPHKRGLLLTLETTVNEPFMIWYFVNTPKITKYNEILPLTQKKEKVRDERVELLNRGIPVAPTGLIGVTVVAAPSYKYEVAQQYRDEGINTTGPVNFEGLTHYLDNHNAPQPNIRRQQYHGLIDYLRIAEGGVMFSNHVVSHLNDFPYNP